MAGLRGSGMHRKERSGLLLRRSGVRVQGQVGSDIRRLCCGCLLGGLGSERVLGGETCGERIPWKDGMF